jgi:hypothetical protein
MWGLWAGYAKGWIPITDWKRGPWSLSRSLGTDFTAIRIHRIDVSQAAAGRDLHPPKL